ncbi:hypothetical protein FDP41_003814 [Naegleria fowleri]|uniref:Phosphatidylinositol N-acetylglucosaminyltransferase n=1 Tax=Naegleria fowleri TaxID=5763 RepID=A0A6A5BS74_NAEFO|nr:uncharacterized protein FDP41_003814 [Naegleria fowleri]KAF0977161.1 hypothetical protein FDP41_003814 [Naegleria fowleri]
MFRFWGGQANPHDDHSDLIDPDEDTDWTFNNQEQQQYQFDDNEFLLSSSIITSEEVENNNHHHNNNIHNNNNINNSNHKKKKKKKLRICMVSDFFYPGFGGVESHIYCIATGLIQRGHKVIIITSSYGNRKGIRYLSNGLKVYHVPIFKIETAAGSATLPFVLSLGPLMRNILIREGIEIVHGHQCTSNMCNQALCHAKTMGLKTFFTDHSLFGFGDHGGMHINKVSRLVLSEVDHVICVSHTLKENLTLRSSMNPFKMTVIPHAVDTGVFQPKRRTLVDPKERLKIVSISRLVYRKGADILIAIIPIICKKYPMVDFIIAGDGPKLIEMNEMIEKHELFDRVELLGAKPYSEVPQVLQRGHLFINTSLTEAFCMAILEAASCGLFVVSTNVGGVREVLPDREMVLLADPTPVAMCEAIDVAIKDYVYKCDPLKTHARVREMYHWEQVVECTEQVYNAMMESGDECQVEEEEERGSACSTTNSTTTTSSGKLIDRLLSYHSAGTYHGKISALIMLLDHLIFSVLVWIYPRESIDVCPDPTPFYINSSSLKNHDDNGKKSK